MRAIWVWCCLAALTAQGAQRPPAVMVWAWETQSDLRRLDPARVGVAFFAAGLAAGQSGAVVVTPRRQALRTASGAYEMPVVRIVPYHFDVSHHAAAVDAIVKLVRVTRARALQLDYDAPQSELAHYRTLIEQVRKRLGPGVFLSITALASWCGADSWVKDLPVDEVVPMAFRMGYADSEIRDMLAAGRDFAEPRCKLSLGITTDEKPPALPARQRVYVFASWSTGDGKLDEVIRQVEEKR